MKKVTTLQVGARNPDPLLTRTSLALYSPFVTHVFINIKPLDVELLLP
jgi:hypothetical protein